MPMRLYWVMDGSGLGFSQHQFWHTMPWGRPPQQLCDSPRESPVLLANPFPMSDVTERPATIAIPVQLSEPEFIAFILPQLSMPRRGQRWKAKSSSQPVLGILDMFPPSETRNQLTVYHHRSHIVWITKYRYKVLEGALRERIRVIIRQLCDELGVRIASSVLSKEHAQMFVEIPPHIAVSDFVRRVKGRSSHQVQMEFPDLRKRYWGRHFWARGYFCTTSGNLTDDVILQYLRDHEPTGVSR